MPQDAFTLMHTARELNLKLSGAKIEKINQPSKDCVVFNIRKNNDNLKLIINANADFARICVSEKSAPAPVQAPSFCMLLRKHLSRASVEKIQAVDFERIVVVYLNCRDELGTLSTKRLYCEIMGKYSNVTLVEDGKILGAMKTTGMDEDLVRPIYPGAKYSLPKSQDKCEISAFFAATKVFDKFDFSEDLSKFIFNNFKGISYPTANDIVLSYYQSSASVTSDVKTFKTDDFIKYFYDYYNEPKIAPTLVSDGKKTDFFIVRPKAGYQSEKAYRDINSLVDDYYLSKEKSFAFSLKKNRLTDATRAYEKKLRKKLQIALEKLVACDDMEDNRLFGELIIAYMYKIKSGEKFAEVEDYTKQDYPLIKISLDENLSPKENAERYFKRYLKQKKTVVAVRPQVDEINEKLKYLDTVYAEIDSAETDEDFADIEEELTMIGIVTAKKSNAKKKTFKPSKPRYYRYMNFDIFVGRNNIQNDRLTLSADRNDVWLHTKNYHSSHVIIKTDGREVPDQVLLYSAEICAFFSQAKTATKVPVDYTLKKYVKKPSGTPIGTVYYTNQKTIIVDPNEHI